MIIEYHPDVEDELADVRDFYESRSTGLGYDFLNEFERNVILIASSPYRWRVTRKDLRRCLMQRFPYTIYFRIIADERIRITLVKHQRRHPSYGMDRR